MPLRSGTSAEPTAPYVNQLAWLKQIKKDVPNSQGLRQVRVAILGSGTLTFLADIVGLWFRLEGYSAEIYVCAYGSAKQEIFDSESDLYAFRPDIVWLISNERDMAFRPIGSTDDSKACQSAVSIVAEEWRACWKKIQSQRPIHIIQSNFDEPFVRGFGHFEATVSWSRSSLIQALNRKLGEFAQAEHVVIFDQHYVAACFGLARWREERQWYQSKQPFNPDAFGLVAFQFVRLVGPLLGKVRKCLVLDLDNTLWGGVIGDDGVFGIRLGEGAEGEAYTAFQEYLKGLLDRGILLAICSKNEPALAEEPFRKHPAMRLRLEDFSCFYANWESKADNIRRIAETLNIGLEALVFVDDNPAERELVQSQLPEVLVVSMSEDPSNYPADLSAAGLFETASFSLEDAHRVQAYRENAQRECARNAASDLNSFLRDLEMEADGGPLDRFHMPRMAQLLAKTNQFHLTTTRYNEAELAALAANRDVWVRWFSLRDRIGDHGLISVAILRRQCDDMVIDTWAMSCRVFSRGMEEFVFLEMLDAARASGARRIVGRFKPTARNHHFGGLYKRLGFRFDCDEADASRWILELSDPRLQIAPFIRRRERCEELNFTEVK